MAKEMTLSFHSAVEDEHERRLMEGDLEERKLAFKSDEELMRETTKFVTDVIETAAAEATKRKQQSQDGATSEGSRLKGGDIIAGWNNRARGFCNRILNALCPCFTNNDVAPPSDSVANYSVSYVESTVHRKYHSKSSEIQKQAKFFDKKHMNCSPGHRTGIASRDPSPMIVMMQVTNNHQR